MFTKLTFYSHLIEIWILLKQNQGGASGWSDGSLAIGELAERERLHDHLKGRVPVHHLPLGHAGIFLHSWNR